jgi:hypothetical protein
MTREVATAGRKLTGAVERGAVGTVARLLAGGAPADAVTGDGRTLLLIAAGHADPSAVRLLLTAGADPERPASEDPCGAPGGELPLCAAALEGHAETVRALLAGGARPGSEEEWGYTALDWAVLEARTEVVRVLLDHGADPCRKGPSGEAPLVTAARRGVPGPVRALLGHGAGADRAAAEEALTVARGFAGRNAAGDLLRELLTRYPDSAELKGTTRVRRDGDGAAVVAEVSRNGRPVASLERGTGHAVIAEELERALRTAD